MNSIYQDFYQFQKAQGSNEPAPFELSDPSKRPLKFLHTARLFLTNAKIASSEFLKGRLSNLDPIVGENSCQIRALGVLMSYEDARLMQEAELALEKTQALLKHTITLQNKLPLCKPDISIEEFIEKTGLSFDVSEKMLFIFRSNLLTVGKVFHFDPNGVEVSRIDCSTLAQRLSKSASSEVVKGIVHVAREQIASQSIRLIQEEAGKLKEVPWPASFTKFARHLYKRYSHARVSLQKLMRFL